ncbi:MAG TPA: thioredoxin domain-containing protein [Anaerolineales bacterium]
MTNRLSTSTSPYLLQHAHNPVDWYPWSDEALARARAEDKPIFLSIGYAACHWCHVMAHESFEDPETAALMNAQFVCIKVDREERPDLDGIYMQAVTAMTGSGGWPMSVFLTPDLQPFYSGTYFPPVPRYNMPSFKDLLNGLAKAWRSERAEILRIGGEILTRLQERTIAASTASFTLQSLDGSAEALLASYDWSFGGWGRAPKFPQPMSLEFMLRRALANPDRRAEYLKLVTHALRAMARGGMYDVVGGGFSRYSTDNSWRVPHFEKMLYDNAQLSLVYLHAWQVTGEAEFRRVAEETLDFVLRELSHPQGGFYSSLDADSEGVEGKYYVWTIDEIRAAIPDEAEFEFVRAAYGLTPSGNWEGKTILQRALDDGSLAARFKLDPEAVPVKLSAIQARLLAARAVRVRPGTDDKILTSWNGLMLTAFAEAARVFGESKYLSVATRTAHFLLESLMQDGKLRRSWRDGQATREVFLEDYAALILALLESYQTDFDDAWFNAAQRLADEMIGRFRDPAGGFFDTPADGELLLIRPKDLQDSATPSGNALAAEALLKLAAFTDRGEYRDLAEETLALAADAAARYPTSYARWLSAADLALAAIKQVALVGSQDAPNFKNMLQTVRSVYRPNMVVAAAGYPPSSSAPPLLADRPLVNGVSAAYVCEGFVCRQPVTQADALAAQLAAA